MTRSIREIMTDELNLIYPLDALKNDFDADDYDLDCQVFCEFMNGSN